MARAGKRGRSSQARSRNQRYGRREVGIRDPLPIVTIVCDDSRTAPAYFTALQRSLKQGVTMRVIPHPYQPQMVLQRAREEVKRQSEEDSRDKVWALIDLEGEASQQQQARDAKKQGEECGVHVALSHPCFEVWTLLHLENTGRSFVDCEAVRRAIDKRWRATFSEPFERKKAQADYTKLISRMDTAVRRARKHHEAGDPSWTEVYLVIEDIIQYMAQDGDSG